MRGASCVHRRHHSDHHTQPGCQRHCVDENLERRNHYLDLAGIENYTSRFGAGEWTAARARGESETLTVAFWSCIQGPSLLRHLLGAIRWNYQPTALLASTNIWARTNTIHQVFKAKAHQQCGLLCTEILGLISSSLDLMVSDDMWLF